MTLVAVKRSISTLTWMVAALLIGFPCVRSGIARSGYDLMACTVGSVSFSHDWERAHRPGLALAVVRGRLSGSQHVSLGA